MTTFGQQHAKVKSTKNNHPSKDSKIVKLQVPVQVRSSPVQSGPVRSSQVQSGPDLDPDLTGPDMDLTGPDWTELDWT